MTWVWKPYHPINADWMSPYPHQTSSSVLAIRLFAHSDFPQRTSMMEPHLVAGRFVKQLQSLCSSNKVVDHMLRCQIGFVPVHQSRRGPSIRAIERDEEADRACPERLLLTTIIRGHTHTHWWIDRRVPVGRGQHGLLFVMKLSLCCHCCSDCFEQGQPHLPSQVKVTLTVLFTGLHSVDLCDVALNVS